MKIPGIFSKRIPLGTLSKDTYRSFIPYIGIHIGAMLRIDGVSMPKSPHQTNYLYHLYTHQMK